MKQASAYHFMTSENTFAKISGHYSQWRPRYPSALFAQLASLCPSRQYAWDCATGNGQAAIGLADYFENVEATDISAEQISAASTAKRVRYSVQPAEATEFPEAHFDLITVAQALHWFDHDRFWPEVQRVLKPHGIFAAWSYVWPQVTPAIDRIVQEQLFAIIRPFWSERNRLAWNGYKDLQWPFTELRAPEIDFRCEWTCNQFLAFLRTLSATTRCMEQHGDRFFTEFAESVRAVWDSEETMTVKMDFHLRVGKKGSR
jgi:ubiquinone/menaquinone biosynthesis C-methylase UbiE